ncbi:MAG: hypothetical protein R2762_06635 [Bryobacteraceae bacterium]
MRPSQFLPHDDVGRGTHRRHGSLLHLRLAAIQDKLYPLFLRLDGDVPGENPRAAIKGESGALRAVRENAMDAFLASITGR